MATRTTTMPDRPQHGTCSGPDCGRHILWVVTLGDARMALDPEPAPDGNVVPVELPGGVIRARVLAGHELTGDPAWVPHTRTCPNSAHFHRRRAAAAPKCPACRGVMDPWLLEHGFRYHVCCGPDPVPARAVSTHDRLPGLEP